MSNRLHKIGNNLCEQDQLIIDMFDGKTVNYIGPDQEFKQYLNVDEHSENLILVFNSPIWLSDLINTTETYLSHGFSNIYISVNRYFLLGNDTNISFESSSPVGLNIINLIDSIALCFSYKTIRTGYFDEDHGGKYNFLQPITWVLLRKNDST